MSKKKLSAFEKFLWDPQVFSYDTIVFMAEWNTPESFFEAVNKAIEDDEIYPFEEKFTNKEEFIKNVKEDWVHCHINWADDEFGNRPAWWLWSKWTRWAKKVLRYY